MKGVTMTTRRDSHARRRVRLLALPLAALTAMCSDAAAPDRVLVMELVSGQAQELPIETTLTADLVVRVVDLDGEPRGGVPVDWVVREGGGSVVPATSSTRADGTAEATWTLGTEVGTQNVEALARDRRLAVNGDRVVFEATATPPHPDDWMDVLGVEALAEMMTDPEGDAFFVIGVRLTNQWGGPLRLRTQHSCLMSMTHTGPDGNSINSYGGGCWTIPITRTIAPDGAFLDAVWLDPTSLEPGTHTVRIYFEKLFMNDGRLLELPDMEAEGTVE
jgi:hypothetical protein